MLSLFALGAIALTATSRLTAGSTSAATLLAVGLMNSIMFPTIFSQSLRGISEDAPEAAGLLCMAIVGGAILPVVTGALADWFGLGLALAVPALGYLGLSSLGNTPRRRNERASGSATVLRGVASG